MEALKSGANIGGKFHTECWRTIKPTDNTGLNDVVKMVYSKRRGKYEPRRLVWSDDTHNLVTTEGLNRILDVMFHGTTQTATWYGALVETDTTATAAMNYDVPVYTESTSYDEATRPAYTEAAAAAGSMTNAANVAVFTISATKTMYGASLVSIDTKGDHTVGANNVLYCYAKFAASRPVYDDDIVNLTYVVTAADDGA